MSLDDENVQQKEQNRGETPGKRAEYHWYLAGTLQINHFLALRENTLESYTYCFVAPKALFDQSGRRPK